MKKQLKGLTLVMLITLIFPALGACGSNGGALADRQGNAAIVNGQKIPETMIRDEIDILKKQYEMNDMEFPADQEISIWLETLEKRIQEAYLVQTADKEGIVISDDEFNAEYDKITGQFDSPEAYEEKIAEYGLTDEKLKEEMRNGLKIQKLIQTKVLDALAVADDEVRNFYDENDFYFKKPESVSARHILIKVEKDADDEAVAEARKKVEALLTRIKNGEEFAAVAEEASEGPSGPNGGQLGEFSRGQMVKPFEEAAFSLPLNTVSDPVRTDFGFHLILVEKKIPAGQTAFEEVEAQIRDQLMGSRQQEAIQTYLADLKEASTIEYPNGLPELPQPEAPEAELLTEPDSAES